MQQSIFSRIGWFVFLLLLQVWVCNHIHFLGYATPMPYVYFLLILPGETPRWVCITLGFLLGLAVDIFTNTPGMASAALCASGLLLTPLQQLFAPADKTDEAFMPSIHTLKWFKFILYALSLTLCHCLLFFTIEAFSFNDWQTLLVKTGGSTVLTLFFIVIFEIFRSRNKNTL